MNGEASFPPGFQFGVATSAYQVEGHIENDWAEWERMGRLKEPKARCGIGVDHWNRFEEDLKLTQDLGAGAFRLSLEWARIEPERGRFDEEAIARYRRRLERMREVGIRPVVTLHHFTHPRWFHRETPWHERSCLESFRRYARACAGILRGLDPLVITFNEPTVLLLGGYVMGLIPPGISDGAKAASALVNLMRCHLLAREELLSAGKAELGISQNVLAFAPDRAWHPLDRALTHFASRSYNHAFIDALTSGKLRISMPGVVGARADLPEVRGSLDFIGVNYYTRAHLRFLPKRPFVQVRYRDVHQRGLTHIGWEDYPEGFCDMLLEMKRYGLPVWITENGIDDRSGERRPSYLYSHWRQLLQAQRQGVDLRGYLYWSLLDNFEWLEGWGPRFGLYRVDFDTLERRPTPACAYFRRTALSRELLAPQEEASPEPGMAS
ncbi:MAG: family 1 glycosylhydrolase [Myxococcales bacterium]|nr:family 1 glycosylhydrolase [Myxococcales bacterium]